MKLGNQVRVPTVILAKGIQGVYFLTRKSEILTGQISQATSVYFEVHLKITPGDVCSSPLQACTPRALTLDSLESGYIYIDFFFFLSETKYIGGSNFSVNLLFLANHSWA